MGERDITFVPTSFLKFEYENFDGDIEQEKVEFFSGDEMIQIIKDFNNENYEKLFSTDRVVWCDFKGLFFEGMNDNGNFNLSMSYEDIPFVHLTLDSSTLKDKNADKIEAIKKIINPDTEDEDEDE